MTNNTAPYPLFSHRTMRVDSATLRVVPIAVFIVCTSFLFTRLCLYESSVHGRLSASPYYDDCDYFYTGARLLKSIRAGEALDALTSYFHSPCSAGLACTAFAIWGPRDWAPYAGNVLLVACFLGLLSCFLRRLPLGIHLGLLVAFLSFPFAVMGVVEFRPDLLWAILVGFLGVYQVTAASDFSSRREAVLLGVLFALALMAKPATFLMTIGIVGLGGLLRLIRSARDQSLAFRQFLAWCGLILLIPAVLAGPYYLFHFREIWGHFYDTSFGTQKGVWVVNRTLLEHLGYYIGVRGGSPSNLGNWRLPMLILVPLGVLAGIVRPASPERRRVFLALGLLLIAAWLASSSAGYMTPFLGGGFYGTLLFAGAFLAAEAGAHCNGFLSTMIIPSVLDRWRTLLGRPVTQVILFIALAGVAFAMRSWPEYSEWAGAKARFHRKVNQDAWKAIKTAWGNTPPADGVLDVYYSNTLPVPAGFLKLRALQQKIPLKIHTAVYEPSLEKHRDLMNKSDIVIVQDANLDGVFLTLPAEAIQDRLTQEAFRIPACEQAAEITWRDGKHIYILRNPAPLPGT